MYDIAIAGGGINGCGIARDAAGRGYSVMLAEMNDLASGTSSSSTKLIHGGLRYLEHYEFRLVRESLLEREVLWKIAPHIVHPLRFVLPHHSGLRPAWLLRLGLFIYDHLGGRKRLPPTHTLNMRRDETGRPLKPLFTKGFEYSDLWVDDARLVVLNARDAADRGADINTRTQIVGAKRENDHWTLTLEDKRNGSRREEKARVLINAAGPWIDKFLSQSVGRNNVHNVRLVQGSHIVVPKIFDHDRCYIFQNADERIIFAIPYENDFTLIGTTDQDYEGDPADVRITQSEIDYLCESASEYFAKPVRPDKVVWTYSGVRPLYDDGATKAQEATRDYVLKKEGGDGEAPLINIFGGKITTYRRLAEEVMEMVGEAYRHRGQRWTGGAPLPGGDFDIEGFDTLVARYCALYPFLSAENCDRLARQYGTKVADFLCGSFKDKDLGENFGHGLYAAEVRYLMESEWAQTAEDVLWRRSKLGLRFSDKELQKLYDWMQNAHRSGLKTGT